jgi:hypothetical protein
VDQVMGQWSAPDGLGFKVRVVDRVFLLQYQQALDVWEVELARSRAIPPAVRENYRFTFPQTLG